MRRRPYLVVAGLAILVAAAFVAYPETGPALCEADGGKWSGASNSCITRTCYKDHTCGLRASPSHYCDRLHLNDPISEVYFQLGEPDAIENGKYRWHAGKISSLSLIATFTQGTLASLTVQADPGLAGETEGVPRACVIGPQARFR